MKRAIFALAVSACALFRASAAPDFRSDPAAFQTEAYICVIQADQALDEGDDATARAYYAEGLDLFRELAKAYPGWEPRVIAYRIAYCEEKLEALADAPRVMPETAVVSAAAPAAAPARPATVPADEDAASALSRAKADRAEALARAHAAEQALAEMQSRDSEASGTLKTLEARLARQAEETRAALAAKDAEIAKGREAAAAAEAKAEEAEAEAKKQARRLAALENSLSETAGELERAREEIGRLEKALGEAELAEAKAREEMTLLSQDLSEAEKRLAAREAEAAAAQAAAPRAPVAAAPAAVEPTPVQTAPAPGARTAVETLLAQGKHSAALAAARAALKEVPGDKSLRELEGLSLLRLKRYTEAMGVLVPLAEANRDDAAIHSALGAAFMGARYTDEARDAYEVAVKIDPKRRDAHWNLAQLYAFSEPKNLRKARKHYEKAKELGLPPSARLDAALAN